MDVVLEHRFFKGKNNNNQENFNHPFYDFDDYPINITLEDSFYTITVIQIVQYVNIKELKPFMITI